MSRPLKFPRKSFQDRYAVLLDVASVLNAKLDTSELFSAIHEQASRVLESTGFYISLFDEATDSATLVFAAEAGSVSWPDLTYRGSNSPAIQQRTPVLSHSGEGARVFLEAIGVTIDSRCSVDAPMVRDGTVIGLISAHSEVEEAYDWDDVELLAAIADIAAGCLENARFVAELRQRGREAERLEEIGRALSASLDLTEVLERIVGAALELVAADGATLWLLRPDATVEVAATGGGSALLPRGTRLPVPAALHQKLFAEESPLLVDDIESSEMVPAELRRLTTNRSLVLVPLRVEEDLIGALSIGFRQTRRMEPADFRLLQRLAGQAVVAVANARLHDEIRTLSLTDPLTGLPNRRQLELFLGKEFAAAQRGRQLTVVLFDLDGFKEFNDVRGHQAGDRALVRFGEILLAESRTMNLAARYGGDEFIVVLSGTEEEGGHNLAERVRKAVLTDPMLARLGVSAGVASFRKGLHTPEELIGAADRELYKEKSERQNGRDRS